MGETKHSRRGFMTGTGLAMGAVFGQTVCCPEKLRSTSGQFVQVGAAFPKAARFREGSPALRDLCCQWSTAC